MSDLFDHLIGEHALDPRCPYVHGSTEAETTCPTILDLLRAQRSTPESAYVVSYGCGTHGVLQPDGTWLITEDHQPSCEHERPNES